MTRTTPADARRDILAAAARHFATRGYAGTSLQDIAADVGYSKSAVLYHFTSKGQMMRDLLVPPLDALSLLDAEVASLEPGLAQDRAIRGFVEVTVRYRFECRLIPGALRDLSDVPELADLRLAELGFRLIAAMAGRPDDPAAMMTAMVIVLGIPPALADLNDLPDEFLRETYVAMARRALGVAPDTAHDGTPDTMPDTGPSTRPDAGLHTKPGTGAGHSARHKPGPGARPRS